MNLNEQLNKLIFKKHLRRLDESLLDVRQKNAKNLSDEQFKQLMNYDPIISQIQNLDDTTMASTNESYSRWLLKMFKNGSLQNAEPEVVRKLLQDFEVAKKRRNLLPNNDINFYKNIDDLQNALSNIDSNLTTNQKNKDAKKAQNVIKKELTPGIYLNGGAELLFIDDDWEVWTPHTYEGSKALRHGACWCTGGDYPNYYESYTKEGQLFVFFDRKNPKEKYQLFVPEDDYSSKPKEFRDKNNDSLSFREFANQDSELVNFLMTIDIINDNYEDLNDPNIDDEWNDEKEEEIMIEYNLGYEEWSGEIATFVDYDELVNRTYYTSYYDYKDMASHGYLEDGIQGEYQRYMSDVISEVDFTDDVDWEETDLFDLYNFFKKDSGLTEYSFKNFLRTLFLGCAEYTESNDYNEEIAQWFEDRNHSWRSLVFNCFTSYALQKPYEDFIYNKLRELGWDTNSSYHNGRSQSYLDQFKNAFMYIFDDCHSFEQFWDEYTDRGEYSLSDIIEKYDIEINEEQGDIDPADCDWSEYSSECSQYDSKEIVNVFMSNQEWNNFISSTENSNENNDTENTKLYNGVKCSINNNYYVFHDEGALFYVPKKEIEENIDYYNRWGQLRLGGLPFEIIREQISKYPESYIREILLKYGGLDDKQKEFYEKNTIRTDDVDYHLTKFIENTIEDYVKKHSDKKEVEESLFEPDW